MPEPIRILIVDDHALVRKGLAMVLRLEPDIEVVGEAENWCAPFMQWCMVRHTSTPMS